MSGRPDGRLQCAGHEEDIVFAVKSEKKTSAFRDVLQEEGRFQCSLEK